MQNNAKNRSSQKKNLNAADILDAGGDEKQVTYKCATKKCRYINIGFPLLARNPQLQPQNTHHHHNDHESQRGTSRLMTYRTT